jgi:hypothetical protein
MEFFGIWIAAFLTLCIYSFLYRDNPFYRFAEYLFVGISLGYTIVISIHQGFIPLAWKPFWTAVTGESLEGLIKLIPICIGLLFFARFSSRHAWLVRYPIAILIGAGSGLAIPNVLRANIFEQTRGTVEPFAAIHAGTLSGWGIFEAVLMVVGVICTLTYFFFSVEHRGPVKWLSKVGIAFLMVGFGSAFGNTVMGRVALLIQRIDFLLNDWIATIF